MSIKAQAILEEIRSLPPEEQREISLSILEHLESLPPRRQEISVAELTGHYRGNPEAEGKF
jgi:hypothetical protein